MTYSFVPGKSSLGNSILNADKFEMDMSPNSITTKCACGSREFNNKRLFIVDTPGFLDPNVAEKEIQQEVAKSYQMTALPGPHVFLLVLEPTRFTEQEAKAVEYLSAIFGPQAIHHTIIIFTHGDGFARNRSTIETYLGRLKPDAPLKKLVDQCGNRYLSVNNIGTDAEKQTTIEALLKMITKMVRDNGGQVYRNEAFDALAVAISIEKSSGTFSPFNPDGSYRLLPKTEEIVIEGFLRRTIGKKNAF
jgi:GTPase Era involved in 16S rRNA processing